VFVPYVGDIHGDVLLDFLDVEKIAAVLRDEGIDEDNLGRIKRKELPREVAPDKAEPTGY
jgi:hypothetical protein